jgi:hypothetical protein
MTRNCWRAGLALSIAVAAGPPAAAQGPPPAGVRFQYAWYSGGSPVAGSINVTAGQTFTLDVYLSQTAGTPNFLTQEGGLIGAGVRATYGSPTGNAGVISVAGVTDITVNTQFNQVADSNATRQANANFAQFSEFTDTTFGVLPDAQGRILVGSFRFTTATNPTFTQTLLRAADIPGSTETITFSMGNFTYALDSAIDEAALTVNFIPVPEPGLTLGLAAVGAVALTRAGRPRRA